jgi:hypothetical protein
MLRAAAGRAAAAGFWKTKWFCTASNAAIGRLWVWGVSHIALPSWSASPPHAPQTHGRVQTQLNQRAGCACADPVPRNAAHACRAPAEVRTRLLPRCWTRIRARERWRGERYRQTPGDHATNLGATMLVLLNGSAGLLLRKTRHAVTQRASASLCTKCTRFDIIAVLYTCTTVASRVATNACATHLRFLTKPQTPSGLASSPLRRYRGPGVVMT